MAGLPRNIIDNIHKQKYGYTPCIRDTFYQDKALWNK